MSWRLARSLETLRRQIDTLAPARSKASDGTIGDAAHQARKSDHNPNAVGVVQALDLTHDPAGGCDAHALAETLRLNRDPRIKYAISNRRIFSAVVQPWTWRPYSGANAHDRHVHISVDDNPARYDDASDWKLAPVRAVASPRFAAITATVFGGPADSMAGARPAYADVGAAWWARPGVSLPYRFPGKRPTVRVHHAGRSVTCPVIDVGPWNTRDPYWLTGTRPQAESGTDMTGRRTNLAGIDLTPAAAQAIGLPGKGLVDWEFIVETTPMPADPNPPNPNNPNPNQTIDLDLLAQKFADAMIVAMRNAGYLPSQQQPALPPPDAGQPVPPSPVPPSPPAPDAVDRGATGAGFLGLILAAAGQLFGFMPTVGDGAGLVGPTVTTASLLATAGGALGALSPTLGFILRFIGGGLAAARK